MNGMELEDPYPPADIPDEQTLLQDIQNLGPTFVKLAQLLSTRPDLIAAPYSTILSKLQDHLAPFPYATAAEIVESELGIRISQAFTRFDEVPLAAASLGQVHMATLHSGQVVAVKIQRPGIRQQVIEELEVLDELSQFLEKNTALGKKYDLHKLLLNFKGTLIRELNYLKEAQHMDQLHHNLKHFRKIVVPRAIPDYTSDKVLTMEFIQGHNILQISPIRKMELDGTEICEELFESYLQQIVVDGFMHADPHPGNVYLTDDNCIALLDMGMMAHLSDDLRQNFLKLILAIGEAKSDEAAHLLIRISTRSDQANAEAFRAKISELIRENLETSIQDLPTGRIMFELIKTAGDTGFHLPVELSLVGKALLNLDLVAHTLAPDFNPGKSIRRHAISLMNKLMYKDLGAHHLLSSLLEGKEMLEKMPERLNKILGNVADNKVRITVDAFDERHLMKGFQKVANRITIGLILAALIVGSAQMMKIPTDFTLFGYPGLAILSFLVAMIGAIGLAVNMFFSDES